ncbi:hypothetical protein SLEP1_g2420 [Rubroshorea leprosula]|uniref:Uncharacterized protein n=1 Tax=Rubroshorea leprosula TaxID=152421 RepID=A0AAV5HSJ2_9ROSI|nr:hypothetical protein SLEP1_g2420 [Rubroshorea leprosula]
MENRLHIAPRHAAKFKRGLEFLDLSSRPLTHNNRFQIFANNGNLCMAMIGPDNLVLSWVVHRTFQNAPLSVHAAQMDVAGLRNRVENIRRDNRLCIRFRWNQNHPNMQEHVAMDWQNNTLTIYKHGHLVQPMNLNFNFPHRQRIRINTVVLRSQLQQIFGPFHNHPQRIPFTL